MFPDRLQGPALADGIAFGLRGAGGKTVNIGARKDSYGIAIADSFSKQWQKLGGSIGKRVEYQLGLPNYDSEAQQITSGNPDAIVIIDNADNFPNLGRALVGTGKWDPSKAWGTYGLASADLIKDPGPKAVHGMRVIGPGTPDNAASTTAFAKLYTSSEPTDVPQHTYDAQNFDAVMLCYLAAVAAGSTHGTDMAAELQNVSGPPGKKYTWQQLPQAVDALKGGKDIDYVGASGELDLNDDGDPTAGVEALDVLKNGLTKTGDIPVPARG